MKYIVAEDLWGTEHMVLFGGGLQHNEMAAVFHDFKLVSAGFVQTSTGVCYGKSVSLGVGSREEDTALAKKTLDLG